MRTTTDALAGGHVAPGEIDQAAVIADAAAFCQAYAPRVYRFAAMVSRGEVEAEDLAQDALERALRRLTTYDATRGSMESWLWQITLSAARDARRRAWRFERLLERLRPSVREGSDDRRLLALVNDDELLVAIRDLRERDRELIALRFGGDMALREVGSLLGLSEAAAGVAVRRAVARLRRRLRATEDES